MGTGVKISELEEALTIEAAALIEIAQAGDNFKVPYSRLVPIISGIGRATVAGDVSLLDFDDLVAFERGAITSVAGTNLEAITANGPNTGLLDGDLVEWHVFTLGTNEEVVQLAFSSYATAQQVQIRYGNLYSDSIWSTWSELGSGGGGGVSSIIAGTGVTIDPLNGLGDVTINASGGGGGELIYKATDNEIRQALIGALDIKRGCDIGDGYYFLPQELDPLAQGLPPGSWFGIALNVGNAYQAQQGGALIVQFNEGLEGESIAVCKLSNLKFALYTASRKWEAYEYKLINDNTTNYETNAEITLISNPVSFATPALANSDWVTLCQLSSHTQPDLIENLFVIFDNNTKNLQSMFFDGFDFSAVGTPLNLPLAVGEVMIDSLTGNSIVLFSPNEDKLYYLFYSGATWNIATSLFLNSGSTLYSGLVALNEVDIFLAQPNQEINNYRLVNGTFVFNQLVETFDTFVAADNFVIGLASDGKKLLKFNTMELTVEAGSIDFQIGEGNYSAKGDVIQGVEPKGSTNSPANFWFPTNVVLTANVDNRLGENTPYIRTNERYFGPPQTGGQGLVYFHLKPAWFNVSVRSNGYLQNLSTIDASLVLGLNGLAWEASRQDHPLNNVDGAFTTYNSQILLNPFDELTALLRPVLADTLIDGTSLFLSAEFDRFAEEDLTNLQEELFENPTLINQDGIVVLGGNAIFSTGRIEYISTGAVGVVRINVTGLEIGQRYRIVIPVNQGDGPGVPNISSSNFGVFTAQEIRPSDNIHTVDLIATAIGGYIQITLDSQVGTNIYVRKGISIKAYL